MRAAKPLEAPREGRGSLASASAAPSGDAKAVDEVEGALSDFAEVPDPTAPGFRRNGVIFISDGFELGRCSGASVNAPNLSLVFTAGHCVNDGGQGAWFNRDWVFVPGYHDGVRPFGVFVAKWLGTTEDWIDETSPNADVGVAVVSRNERGRRLGAVVGGYDIAWNRPPHQVFDIHGYPAEAPFDGAGQRICSATPFLGHDLASFLWLGPLNLAARCSVAAGASGGAWTIEGDTLNSVTSYVYEDDMTTDFGPYFGDAVRALYRRASQVR